MTQAIWWTMFSVIFPPENSQNRRQLMNLYASNGRSARPFRNAPQFTLVALQSAGTGLTHCPCPWGELRDIQDSTCAIFPSAPLLIQSLVSASPPELSCCNPIWITRSDLAAAA